MVQHRRFRYLQTLKSGKIPQIQSLNQKKKPEQIHSGALYLGLLSCYGEFASYFSYHLGWGPSPSLTSRLPRPCRGEGKKV